MVVAVFIAMTLELALIALLLVVNGYLAFSEIAIVSARRVRLEQHAERDPRARAALALSESPTRFLSTVQVGITLVGVMSGAFGGAALADSLATFLSRYDRLAPHADAIAMGTVVLAISYLSVVAGELVPKRLALTNPERFAMAVARPMTTISRVAGPAVTLLERTSNVIFRVLRLPDNEDMSVTEADVTAMVAAGTSAGVFEPAERRMVERALRLDSEPVAAMMTPRRDIVWLDANGSPAEAEDVIRKHPFSRFPVCDGGLDRILGVLHVRDFWLADRAAPAFAIRSILRPPLLVPESAAGLALLDEFQRTGIHLAFVIDEHGGIDGAVTLNNLLQFLVAEPSAAHVPVADRPIVRRGDDSWLVDGSLSLGDFYSEVGIQDPEHGRHRAHHTVAGLVMTHVGRIPVAGDRVAVGSLTLEVADMDGYRIDKVLATVMRPAPAADSSSMDNQR
jgi:putative hemolysin